MGKRKKSSRKPQGPKKREVLPTTFNCLFCNHENAVTCKLDKKAGVGSLSCKICGQDYQSNITYLSHPVDVYSDWVDACEEADRNAKGSRKSKSGERAVQKERYEDEGQGGGGRDEPGNDAFSDLDDEVMQAPRRRAAVEDDDEDDF